MDKRPAAIEQADTPFAEWLRAAMDARGISLRQLAARSDVHHTTISRLLREGRSPTLDTVRKLARVLEADPTNDVTVSAALRRDPLLSDEDVRSIIGLYLHLRTRRASKAGPVAAVRRSTTD